jgi:hypothetical protein
MKVVLVQFMNHKFGFSLDQFITMHTPINTIYFSSFHNALYIVLTLIYEATPDTEELLTRSYYFAYQNMNSCEHPILSPFLEEKKHLICLHSNNI